MCGNCDAHFQTPNTAPRAVTHPEDQKHPHAICTFKKTCLLVFLFFCVCRDIRNSGALASLLNVSKWKSRENYFLFGFNSFLIKQNLNK